MKIAIFGSGNIGAAVANDLIVSDSLSQKIDSIALVDAVERIARGKALDLAHTAAVYECDLRISGSTEPGDIADAGIVVITAGRARKAGQSREELFGNNAAIIAQCARDAAKYAPNSIIVVVTNPLDMMVYAALQASGFAKERVIGMAGELDGARLKFELARASGKEISSMRSAIVGPHSEEMIALKNELGFEISDEIFERAVQNTKRAGAQIGELGVGGRGEDHRVIPCNGAQRTHHRRLTAGPVQRGEHDDECALRQGAVHRGGQERPVGLHQLGVEGRQSVGQGAHERGSRPPSHLCAHSDVEGHDIHSVPGP